MKNLVINAIIVVTLVFSLSGCLPDSQETKDQKMVQRQQGQYAKAQPVPVFDWSLERDLIVKLYQIRNQKLATHSVWRSDYGMIEGDCPSMGYGIPYDTSLTNPLMATSEDQNGSIHGLHQLNRLNQMAFFQARIQLLHGLCVLVRKDFWNLIMLSQR